MPIYGHTYFAYNSSIFCPISKKLIQGCSGGQNLPDQPLFGWVGCKIKNGLCRCPHMGVATAQGAKGMETPKPHQKFRPWVGLHGQPISRNRLFQIIQAEPPPLKRAMLFEYLEIYVILVVLLIYVFQFSEYQSNESHVPIFVSLFSRHFYK